MCPRHNSNFNMECIGASALSITKVRMEEGMLNITLLESNGARPRAIELSMRGERTTRLVEVIYTS